MYMCTFSYNVHLSLSIDVFVLTYYTGPPPKPPPPPWYDLSNGGEHRYIFIYLSIYLIYYYDRCTFVYFYTMYVSLYISCNTCAYVL